MVEGMYYLLSVVGYTHPVHPVIVHVVIGNIIAALIFGAIGLYTKKTTIGRASYYATVLAFVFLFPVVFFGITDWLHFYGGAWLLLIKIKIALAIILFIILLIAVIDGWKDIGATPRGLFFSFLCFLAAIGLGYCGGELVYARGPAVSKDLKIGQQIYINNCNACHPQGGNTIDPSLPLLGSSKLSDLNTFIGQIRNPLLPGGKKGAMPAFAPSKISDEQAKALYEYAKALEKETKQGT